MYPRLPGVPSRSGHYIALNRAPCAIPGVLISYPLYTASMASKCQPHLPIPPTTSLPLGILIFVSCVSISALQIWSSIPFFQISICINIRYLFSLSHFTLGDTLSVHSTSLLMTQFCSFLWLSNNPLSSLVAQLVKNLPAMQEAQFYSTIYRYLAFLPISPSMDSLVVSMF